MILTLAAAALAAAQPQTQTTVAIDSSVPPDMAVKFEAWTRCLIENVEADDGRARPQAVADLAIRACASAQAEMVTAHRTWLAGSTLSDREKRNAARNFDRSVQRLRGQLARMVRMMRED